MAQPSQMMGHDGRRDEIRRLSGPLFSISTDGQSFGADLMALRLLTQYNIGDPEWIAAWLEFKREHQVRRLSEIDDIRGILQRE